MPDFASNAANDMLFVLAGFMLGLVLGGPLRALLIAMLGRGGRELEELVAELDVRLKALENRKVK